MNPLDPSAQAKLLADELAGKFPDARGRFGPFGGRYVPETLVAAFDRLEAGIKKHLHAPDFQAELAAELKSWVGRPTALTHAPRLSQAWGADVWFKREDLAHTGAHKINNALGQALLAKRLGVKRIVAETGAGQHGVASAAACARVGLPCTVYMGAVDMERQAPNVGRMKLLGATVVPVTSGDKTLRAAIDDAFRDWVSDPNDTFYIIGSAVGPHPYPYLVRELQTVIGREARAQFLERNGRLPDAVIACVGGGSNSIGMFHPFIGDASVEIVGIEAGGTGKELGHNAATLAYGRPGVLQGAYSLLLQDDEGQIQETESVSAGLDYPGVGPEHSLLLWAGRVRYEAATDDESLEALTECCRTEGILPAIESAHAFAGAKRWAKQNPGKKVLIGLSGRGDKDMPTLQRTVLAEKTEDALMTPSEKISAAISSARGGTAIVAFMTAGYPRREKFREHLTQIGSAADVVEIGVPFTDPMADGMTIQRSSREALRQGVSLRWLLAELIEMKREGQLPGAPLVLMSYLNPLLSFGFDALAMAAMQAGVCGFIVPDLPYDESAEFRAALDAHGIALILMVTPVTTPERMAKLCAATQGFVYAVTMTGTTGKTAAVPGDVTRYLDAVRAASKLPVCAGFGIRSREQVVQLDGHVAGVIVGSALVEVLESGQDAAAFLRALRP